LLPKLPAVGSDLRPHSLFDEWNGQGNGEPIEQTKLARYGTIDWLSGQYKTEKAYTEKVSPRSAPVMSASCR
jgi:hypothetical protein